MAEHKSRCRCGKTFTRGEWAALPMDAMYFDDVGERRRCDCGLLVPAPPRISFDDVKKAYEQALDEGE